VTPSFAAVAAGVALAVALVLLRRFLVVVHVDGSSMAPALEDGQRVLALRSVPRRLLRRGQVALVAPGGVTSPLFLKRIRGLPGDRLETSLDELHPAVRAGHHHFYDRQGRRVWRVPPRHVFVQGDGSGSDSRAWGPVPVSAVRGVVIARLDRRWRPGA
jgi:signal peptidase I